MGGKGFGKNEWNGGWEHADKGWEDIRLVDKWMRKMERSSLARILKGDEVAGKMVLSEVKEKMEEEKYKDYK